MKLVNAQDILDTAPDEASFLLAPILPMRGLSIIAGSPSAGKSTLVRGLAVAVTKPMPTWLGLTVGRVSQNTGTPVILVHLEESQSEVKRHLKDLGLAGEDELYVLDVDDLTDASFKLDAILEQVKPGLVVIDTLVEMLQIREINSYSEVVMAVQEYRALAERHSTHIMFTHHSPKTATTAENAILGSTGLRAAVDTALVYRKLPRTGTRVLECSKIRTGKEIEALAVGIDAMRQSILIGSAAMAQARENCAWFSEIIRGEGRALTKNDLAQATGLPIFDVWQSLGKDPDNVLRKIVSATRVVYEAVDQQELESREGWQDL